MTKIDLPREKKVAHLTLLRPPRSLTGKEFNALSFAERLAMVRSVGGREKYELLIEARDAEHLVQKLPAQEIYLLIKELGLPDVPELLAFAGAEKFAAFIDLDCWQGDLLDGQTALEWLAVLFRCGEEKVLEIVGGLDFPLLTLILKKLVTVLRGPEDYLDDDARQEASQRDGGYELAYRDPESAKLVGALFDMLNHHEPEFCTRLMESLRWEEEALLEEENYPDAQYSPVGTRFPRPLRVPGHLRLARSGDF